jgi:hypothetical protein
VNTVESEKYFELASKQGDSKAQLQYGIMLLSGLLGRFDFARAKNLFAKASSSNRFAKFLHSTLSSQNDLLITPNEYSALGNIFSFIRYESDENICVIRLMNPHLSEPPPELTRVFYTWKNIIFSSIRYLRHLSQVDSRAPRPLSINLDACHSIDEMVPWTFKMYSSESSLYKNVNCFLRDFPIQIVGKFMKELRGILSYIYLLQSSIEYQSRTDPLPSDIVVYRGLRSDGLRLSSLYESMKGKLFVWRGFTSTSKNRQCVIDEFVKSEEGILFEIKLHPGDVAVDIRRYSDHPHEAEVLIASSSVFRVESVDNEVINDCVGSSQPFTVRKVKLSYEMSWFDFALDASPPTLLV